MFITALFTIARTQKLPKCALTDEGTKKIWYICTMEYYSAIKNEMMPFAATKMDLKIFILNMKVRERSKPDKDKYHMISLICGL